MNKSPLNNSGVKKVSNTSCKNKNGDWVPAIPEPCNCILVGMDCICGKHFYRRESYEAHYALKHILCL